MGTGGKAIPALVDKITNIESDAEFVLLVEKDAAFMRLAEDRLVLAVPAVCTGHQSAIACSMQPACLCIRMCP